MQFYFIISFLVHIFNEMYENFVNQTTYSTLVSKLTINVILMLCKSKWAQK